MQPRRIARELALLGLSQLSANKLDQKRLEDLLLAAIRTLIEEAGDALSTAADEVRRSDRLLHDSEQILPSEAPAPTAKAAKAQRPDNASSAALGRVQQVQQHLHRIEVALRTSGSRPDLQGELVGLAAQAQTALSTASEYLTQLEQRLHSARQILDESIGLSQGAINRVGSALTLPEFVQLAHAPEVRAYALELVNGVQEHKAAVDQRLQAALVGWQLNRLGRIDRDILRLAVVEMDFLNSVPVKVAINEAVELAKKYGNEESASFINGVLRRVVDRVGSEPSASPS